MVSKMSRGGNDDGDDDEILNNRFPLCHYWCMQRQRLRNYGNLRLRTNVSVSITKWSVLQACATIVQHFTSRGHGCMIEALLVLAMMDWNSIAEHVPNLGENWMRTNPNSGPLRHCNASAAVHRLVLHLPEDAFPCLKVCTGRN